MKTEESRNIKSKKSQRKIIRVAFILLLAVIIAVGVYLLIDHFNLNKLNQMWDKDLGYDENEVIEEYEIDPEAEGFEDVLDSAVTEVEDIDKDNEVIDIALIGVDNRNSQEFTGRSDVLIILRVDGVSKELKLVSFMRDTLVEIEGHKYNRINTAFRFGKGKVDLLYDTMQKNFGITPDNYMVVNFFGMEDIIDAMDGVDIELETKELRHLNNYIDEINRIDRSNRAKHINQSGIQHINGRQAVAYMRIRKGGGDAVRIMRQQKVLNALLAKAGTLSIGQIPDTIEALSQYVRTDIPLTKMLSIGSSILETGSAGFERFTYPEKYKCRTYKEMEIVQPADFDEEMLKLKNFLEN